MRIASVALCASVFLTSSLGQSEIGGASLGGTVMDPSGAVVQNVKVTVTQTATSFARSTETSGIGLYKFSLLPAGEYEVTAQAVGFKVAKLSGISLRVGAVATQDVNLEIGTPQETITVTSELSMVESERSQTSTLVDAKAIAD